MAKEKKMSAIYDTMDGLFDNYLTNSVMDGDVTAREAFYGGAFAMFGLLQRMIETDGVDEAKARKRLSKFFDELSEDVDLTYVFNDNKGGEDDDLDDEDAEDDDEDEDDFESVDDEDD